MPHLSDEKAAALAEAEELVSHLTSLVLIDEAGAQQNTLPVTRKIPLATPASAAMYALGAPMIRASFYASRAADFDAIEVSCDASPSSFDHTPAPKKESVEA